MTRMWAFAKGHGTMNDFVLLADPDDALGLTDDDVRFLCDRRAGIGGDGLLRAVRAAHVDGWDGDPGLWFMDYRNADGSLAEMCGNGLRVFVVYLVDQGLVTAGEAAAGLAIGTRAGVRSGQLLPDGRVRVGMGEVHVETAPAVVRVDDTRWQGTGCDVGNPHVVSFLDDGQSLEDLNLDHAPDVTPPGRFPRGVNAEFVRVLGEDVVAMRVFERGVGETMSCGTGTVAVAATVAARSGRRSGSYRILVRGGEVQVDLDEGRAWLTGPAVLVAHGTVAPGGGR